MTEGRYGCRFHEIGATQTNESGVVVSASFFAAQDDRLRSVILDESFSEKYVWTSCVVYYENEEQHNHSHVFKRNAVSDDGVLDFDDVIVNYVSCFVEHEERHAVISLIGGPEDSVVVNRIGCLDPKDIGTEYTPPSNHESLDTGSNQ